jgi:hypothetical protein
MSVLVEVTQDDIDRGRRGKCLACPIARAMNRRTGIAFSVSGSFVRIVGKQKMFSLPDCCAAFAYHFDNFRPVAPFSFWFPTVPHYAAQEPVQ